MEQPSNLQSQAILGDISPKPTTKNVSETVETNGNPAVNEVSYLPEPLQLGEQPTPNSYGAPLQENPVDSSEPPATNGLSILPESLQPGEQPATNSYETHLQKEPVASGEKPASNSSSVLPESLQPDGPTGPNRHELPIPKDSAETNTKPTTNGSSPLPELLQPGQQAAKNVYALPLQGKVALITGAGRGIGAGIARVLAEKGCKTVIINYSSSEEAAERTRKELAELGTQAIAIKADLSKVEGIVHLFQTAADLVGGLDIVVSNSGREKFVPLLDTTEEDFDEVIALNTKAQFFVARESLRHMNQNGSLVLMSSIAAGLGIKGHAIYGGSKSAVESFTRCFAQDFGIKKCTVNAVAPAGIKSDMWASNAWRYAPGCNKTSSVAEIEASLAAGSPLDRVGYPSDIGKVVAFLASEDGRWINGQIIPCNGGANV